MAMEQIPSGLGQGAAGLDRKTAAPPMDRLAELRHHEHCETQKVTHRQKPERTRISSENTINTALEEQPRRQRNTHYRHAEPGKIQEHGSHERNREPECHHAAKIAQRINGPNRAGPAQLVTEQFASV